MKLRKWVKVLGAILLTLLIGKVIYDMTTIRTINNGITCNGKFVKICSSDHHVDL